MMAGGLFPLACRYVYGFDRVASLRPSPSQARSKWGAVWLMHVRQMMQEDVKKSCELQSRPPLSPHRYTVTPQDENHNNHDVEEGIGWN